MSEVKEKKEDIRTIRTKRLLTKSLYELLSNTPFDKLTIQMICDKAMVHRTTYYQHFNNKEELLSYSLNDFRNKLFNITNQKMDYSSPKQMLFHLSYFFIRYVQNNKDDFKNIINNIGSEFLIGKVSYAYEESVLSLLNKTTIEFSVPKPMIAQFYTGGIMKILLNWLESDSDYSINQFIEFINIILNSFEKFLK